MKGIETRSLRSPEFILVGIMLVVLLLLVVAVLFAPLPGPSGEQTEGNQTAILTELLEYRKSILAIIITAFGAWVGAGAAYFFGRENLREATTSLLTMREPSPRERLRRTLIQEMLLKPVDWFVKTSDKLEIIIDRLKVDTWRWFISIVDDKDRLDNVIHEEAIWRFVDKESKDGTPYTKIMEMEVSKALQYIKEESLGRLEEIYVSVKLAESAGDAYERMQDKDVSLAVILDDKGKPTHFITTADIRRVLLQIN